jgi:uncharacterized protein (TIGR00730 family)
MIIAALKAGQEDDTRADLKLMNTTLKEMRFTSKIFGPYRNVRKVTVFGSARTKPHEPVYAMARNFGRKLAESGYMVITGGGAGIMHAVNEGAGPEHSFGVNIRLPFEQRPNPVLEGNPRLITYKYFFNRKVAFLKEANAVALFPGGFGTLDESFEVLTLLQTGKSRLFPIVLVDEPGGDYWRLWAEFVERHLLGRGWISREDLVFFRVTDNAGEAAEEIQGFYRVYHSMRYVGKDLAVRLRLTPSDGVLSRLREDFDDLLESGTFRLEPALPEEEDEPELAELPRLVFRFNRKSFGRLRMVVDFLNREAH